MASASGIAERGVRALLGEEWVEQWEGKRVLYGGEPGVTYLEVWGGGGGGGGSWQQLLY